MELVYRKYLSPSRPAREEREKFIRAKYVDKEFLADLPADRESLPEVSWG